MGIRYRKVATKLNMLEGKPTVYQLISLPVRVISAHAAKHEYPSD